MNSSLHGKLVQNISSSLCTAALADPLLSRVTNSSLQTETLIHNTPKIYWCLQVAGFS